MITEQPAATVRFRYPSEGNSHGGIPGVQSKEFRKTCPTVEVDFFAFNGLLQKSSVRRMSPSIYYIEDYVVRLSVTKGMLESWYSWLLMTESRNFTSIPWLESNATMGFAMYTVDPER